MDGRTLEKRYDEVLRETQFLRDRCRHLEQELNACRPALYRAEQRIDRLEQRNAGLAAENQRLKQGNCLPCRPYFSGESFDMFRVPWMAGRWKNGTTRRMEPRME